MHLIPIFDTSVFIDVSKGIISRADWRRVKKLLPKHGCPISFISLQELLIGLHTCSPEYFQEKKRAVEEARVISRQRVLDQPQTFLIRHTIQPEFRGIGLRSSQMKDWLEVACRAKDQRQLSEGIKYKGLFFGMDLAVLQKTRFDAGQSQIGILERVLNELHPDWRNLRKETHRSLPQELHDEIQRVDSQVWRRESAQALIHAAGVTQDESAICSVIAGADATLIFTASLIRDVLLTDYRFESNSNNLFDGLQLYYLADKRFCFVTQDTKLIGRVQQSTQANRVLTVESFLSNPIVCQL